MALDRLLSYCIDQYFPDLGGAAHPVESFLETVVRVSAELAATFVVAGFVHGVLNSDNMTITGESFDYGPYRFLPTYDLGFVAAYFDHQGLYAFGRQPAAIVRNLARLAESLRPLAPGAALAPILAGFEGALQDETARRVLRRLGLASRGDADAPLASDVYAFLDESKIGYDRFFFDLYGGLSREARALSGAAKDHYVGPAWDALRNALRLYDAEPAHIPSYFDGEGPCTLLIDDVEAVWSAIAERDDWTSLREKIERIREMGRALEAR